ncbi:MAG: metalloregulator ArsR/SmtB family transcription factor [Deltaproteobacteria bacterium]|nr:metalloregulator ArsR/SmtB family transcription factor [Deltaproteobacteria bacterium]
MGHVPFKLARACGNREGSSIPLRVAHLTPKQEHQLDRVFGCLSDPSRRKVIALLREARELKVTDIAQAFDMSLNGVSKHLKVLEEAGLVVRRVDGRVHWFSANWSALQPAYEFLHFHQHFWSQRLDALVDYVKPKAATGKAALAGASNVKNDSKKKS